VDNAIEAMERRGQIVVETQLDAPGSVVRLMVADNGPGIPPGEREKLFLPYYSTKRRGSGLGLAIVRCIASTAAASSRRQTPRGTASRSIRAGRRTIFSTKSRSAKCPMAELVRTLLSFGVTASSS
jgi:C4-dicarboxylate-specific signal transduction histidine kinase